MHVVKEAPALPAADPTPEAGSEPYGTRSTRGGIISTLVQLGSALVNLGTQVALGWFLLPEHFGLLALAQSVVNVVAVFRDAGATQVLIHRQRELHRLASSVFWLSFIASVSCGGLTLVAAPLVSRMYDAPALVPVMVVLALRFPVGSLGIVSQTKLQIDMRWGTIGTIQLVSLAISAVLSIVMAYRGHGVYSLIVPPLVGDALRGLLLWHAAGVRLALRPDFGVVRLVLGSSGFITGTALALSLRGQADRVSLGLFTDPDRTGLYFFAFMTATALSRLSVGGLSSILTPVFAKVAEQKDRHHAILRRAFHVYAAIGVLPIVIQACLAYPIYRLVFSSKWQGAAILFLILTLLNLAKFLNTVTSQAMSAGGHFRSMFLFTALFAPLEIGMYIAGAALAGPLGTACFGAAAAAIDFILWHLFVRRVLSVPLWPLIVPLWRLLVACIPAIVTSIIMQQYLPPARLSDVATIVATTIVGTAGYIAILSLTWQSMVVEVCCLLLRTLRISEAET